MHLNGYQQNGVKWAEKVINIGPAPPMNNIHVIKIPHLHTEQKLDKLMHTDDRLDLVSNKAKDLEQFQERHLYVDNKNANNPSSEKAYQYRHRFGISINEVRYMSSNILQGSINWFPCEELSGK